MHSLLPHTLFLWCTELYCEAYLAKQIMRDFIVKKEINNKINNILILLMMGIKTMRVTASNIATKGPWYEVCFEFVA